MASDEQTGLLREIRDLLRLMAEPALAKRDEALRASLREIVGKSKTGANATLLVDGSRSQAAICAESGIDDGNLSRLTKALREQRLIADDTKRPRLTIPITRDFFEEGSKPR